MTARKNERKTKRQKQSYVAFYCPPALVSALDTEAQTQERTRSQQLRYMLAAALATRPQAHHVNQPAR